MHCCCDADPVVMVSITPSIFSGRDIEPFNTFSLTCTSTKPVTVIPPLQLSWSHDGERLDNSVMGVMIRQETINSTDISSTITLSSARVVDSGMYTCDASISIPDSDTVSTNETANVIISGKE